MCMSVYDLARAYLLCVLNLRGRVPAEAKYREFSGNVERNLEFARAACGITRAADRRRKALAVSFYNSTTGLEMTLLPVLRFLAIRCIS